MSELKTKHLENRSVSQRHGDNGGALEKGPWQGDAGKAPPKSMTPAPNIFLNLRPPERKDRLEILSFAVIGVFIQATVLVFSGLATYHPEMGYRKGGLKVASYAYPLTAVGTVILVVGMLICSFVVEGSTKEKRWTVSAKGVRTLEDEMVKELNQVVQAVPEGVEPGVRGGANDDGSGRGPRERWLEEIKDELKAFGESERRAGILWLQAGGNVNDQVFDSYAIFAHGSRKSVLTSRLATNPPRNDNKPGDAAPPAVQTAVACTPHVDAFPIPTANTSYPPTASNFIQTLAVTGTLISITGFVTQFTGLRGMHWSATIAQFIATLIMTVVRAWIRRGLAQRPRTDRTPQGHELDWLATRIARYSGDLWSEGGVVHWLGNKSEEVPRDFCSKRCWNWSLQPGTGAPPFSFHQQYLVSEAHQVMAVRERIGQLSNWTGTLSSHAISVANSIEVVMNTLFPRRKNEEDEKLFWFVRGTARGDREGMIYLSVKRRENGRWTASATEIEAVLSLWLYAIHEFEEQAQADKSDMSVKEEAQDWLRRGGTALRKTNIRLLGRGEKDYLRDLRWYTGGAFSAISEVEELPGVESDTESAEACDNPNERVVFIDQHRVFGFTSHEIHGSVQLPKPLEPSPSPSGRPPKSPALTIKSQAQTQSARGKRYRARTIPSVTDESELAEEDSDASEVSSRASGLQQSGADRYLEVISNTTPLELRLAQDIFSAFMWAVVRKTKELDGKTILKKLDQGATNTPESWKHFTLENATLARMAKDIERSGLGSLEEIYLTIVPPLSLNKRLPDPLCVVEHAMEVAKPHEAVGHWEDAADAYVWLFRTFSDSDGPVAVKAFSAFTMFTWTIRDTLKLWRNEMHDPKELAIVERLESSLLEEAKSANELWRSCLQTVYQLQRRSMDETEKTFENFDKNDLTRGTRPRSFQPFPFASLTHEIMFTGMYPEGKLHPHKKDLIGLTPLHYSVLSKFPYQQTSRCLGLGADPDSTDMLGWTPLHYAAAYGDEEIIRVLFNSRADPTSKDLAGWTPLHVAAWQGNKSACEMLLQQGARLDIQGRDGLGVLHCAAIRGHREIARRFLEFGAHVDIQDNSRRTPLQWAVYHGDLAMIELLVGNRANTAVLEANGRSLLHLASVGGWWVDTVFDLIRANEVDGQDRLGLTPLHLAAMVGNERASLCLIRGRVHSNNKRSRDEKASLGRTRGNGRAATRRARTYHFPGGDIREEELYEADQIDLLTLPQPTGRSSQMEAQDNEGQTPLHRAALHGQKAVVRLLLDHGAQIDSPNKEEETPLHKAIRSREEAVVQLLVARGARIDAPNKEGKTRLHKAALDGEEEMLQLLLHYGAKIDAPTNEGDTPLHRAAFGEQGAVIRLLLDRGAKIDAPNKHGETPLHRAVIGSDGLVTQLLLDRGAKVNAPNNVGKTPLHLAVGHGSEAVVRLLLDRGAKVDASSKERETPLHEAMLCNNEAVVRLLLDRGANVDSPSYEGETPLHKAALRGQEAVVRLLLDRGVNVDARNNGGKTPLHKAAGYGAEVVVRVLLDCGAKIDAPTEEGETPLHGAAFGEQEAVVRLLLNRGAKTDALSKHGETPLHRAALGSNEEVVRLILDRGANVNATNNEGKTPLHQAAWYGAEAVVRLLIDHGANSDASNNEGETPLHQAMLCNNEAVVRLLLDQGVNIDSPSNEGKTPLHKAALRARQSVVRLLLDRGAKIDTSSNEGETPLHEAVHRSDETVLRLLLDRGANADIPNNEGDTPLHLASGCGGEAAFWVLLNRSAKIDEPNKNGEAPLHKAVHRSDETVLRPLLDRGDNIDSPSNEGVHKVALRGQEAVARLLLSRGVNVDARNNDGKTPLHKAAECGAEAVVRLLLDHGAKIDASSIEGGTPLHEAVLCGDEAVARLLLDRDVNVDAPNQEGKTPLHRAAWYGAEAVVRLLLDRGANIDAPSKHGETPLHRAAFGEQGAVVRLLLNRGAKTDAPSKNGETPLHRAALGSNEEVVRLILDRGANVNAANNEGKTPLHQAAWYGAEAVVRLLLDCGANIDTPSEEMETPLHEASFRNNEAAVRLLLDRGVNVDAVNDEGKTPLHQAAWCGGEGVVRLLLDCGAKIDAPSKDGETPLHEAALGGREEVIRLLLDRGVHADVHNNEGKTPLHKAVWCGAEAVVRLLLDRGAKIDASSNEGETPLHEAVLGGNEAVVRLLLDRGVDVDACNNEEKTPLHKAASYGAEAVVQLLLDRGARRQRSCSPAAH